MCAAALVRQPTLWGGGEIDAGPIASSWISLDGESWLLHEPAWLSGADQAFDRVAACTAWRADRRPMYDRIVEVPRLVAQVRAHSLPHDDPRRRIAVLASEALGLRFDHIGLNHYRDGRDSVAWHGDRLGRRVAWSVVVLVSLGGPRLFRLRRRVSAGDFAERPTTRLEFTLGSGDLFVMAGACQRDYEHTVPKARAAAPRISLGLRATQRPEGPRFDPLGVPPLRTSRKLR